MLFHSALHRTDSFKPWGPSNDRVGEFIFYSFSERCSCSGKLSVKPIFVAGEFGDLLVNGSGGALLEGEEVVNVSGAELLALLEAVVVNISTADSAGREYALTALMKLGAHIPSESAHTKVPCAILTSTSLTPPQHTHQQQPVPPTLIAFAFPVWWS